MIIEQASTYEKTFQYTIEDGRAINLTGAYAHFILKDHADDIDLLVDMYSNTKALNDRYLMILDPPTAGMIKLYLSAQLINTWDFNRGNYELIIHYPSGEQEVLLRGAVRLVKSITV